ncbi:MAG: PBP1A family penicillin-binding protein [Pseudomonadales bacterium]
MSTRSKNILGRIMWSALAAVCAAVLSLAGAFLYLDPQIPKAATYRQVRLETPLRVYTADRQLVAEFGERRLIPVTLDQVPPLFVSAVLDTEDKRFYEHSGVDVITLTTAALELMWNRGEITRGGSTITMQLPRNLGTFSLDQLFIRKFKEILLALKIERELSKDEILELYINAVPFGKRAYGAQAAAYTYYGKPLAELTLPQLAMLAGIPQAPTAGNPINDPQRALARRNVVLSRMLEQRSITREQHDAAAAAPITARLYERGLEVAAPYPAEWVRQQLIGRIPDIYSGGYEVVTTLNARLQHRAREALREGLASYDRRHGYRGPEAHIDVDDREAFLAALGETRDYRELEPAVVNALAEDHATALLADGREIRIDMDGLTWARPYLTVDTRGATPKLPGDVLAVGDLIRLRRERVDAPAAGDAEGRDAPAAAQSRWVLSQVPEIQGALISLDPDTGAVQAMVGGYDFTINQYNHAIQAARQPGSGFKPFVYAAALAYGVTPASIFMDAPLVFDDQNLESMYRPDNDDSRYNGPTRLREALYRSINLVTMRVLLEVGAGNVLDFSKRFGFDTSSFPRNTQLAVGGGTMAVTPMQMAVAYATFANGGHRVEPYVVDEVYDIDGNRILKARHPVVCRTCPTALEPIDPSILSQPRGAGPTAEPGTLAELLAAEDAQPQAGVTAEGAPRQAPAAELPPIPAQRVLDERVAYVMNSMLQDVIRRGTGRRARTLERGDLAGKTGTTNEAADTWFNGYNPDAVTTVWVGFPGYGPLGAREYGSNTPLPIWIDYMREALAGLPEKLPPQPAGIVTMKIDPGTGQIASTSDPKAISEVFLSEFAPKVDANRVLDPVGEEGEEIKPVEIF